jgi:hypothetical protein
MTIVIVEALNTYTMEITYAELVDAVNYAKKERERHRIKSARTYLRKKEKKVSETSSLEQIESEPTA